MTHINNPFYKALELKYAAETEDAKAKVTLYFSNPQGVAGHPNVTEEIDKLLAKLSWASQKLYQLRSQFGISAQKKADNGQKKADVVSPIKDSTRK